jgi:hypothetical protein
MFGGLTVPRESAARNMAIAGGVRLRFQRKSSINLARSLPYERRSLSPHLKVLP